MIKFVLKSSLSVLGELFRYMQQLFRIRCKKHLTFHLLEALYSGNSSQIR